MIGIFCYAHCKVADECGESLIGDMKEEIQGPGSDGGNKERGIDIDRRTFLKRAGAGALAVGLAGMARTGGASAEETPEDIEQLREDFKKLKERYDTFMQRLGTTRSEAEEAERNKDWRDASNLYRSSSYEAADLAIEMQKMEDRLSVASFHGGSKGMEDYKKKMGDYLAGRIEEAPFPISTPLEIELGDLSRDFSRDLSEMIKKLRYEALDLEGRARIAERKIPR